MEDKTGAEPPVSSSAEHPFHQVGQEQFTSLTERIVELESLVKSLVDKSARDEDAPVESDSTSNSSEEDESEIGSNPAVEVLQLPDDGLHGIGYTVTSPELRRCAIAVFYEEMHFNKVVKRDIGGLRKDVLDTTLPSCIVIQSPKILSLLTQISGMTFRGNRKAFLPPFKLFMAHWDSIKQNVANLRKSYDQRLAAGIDGRGDDRKLPDPDLSGVTNDNEPDHETVKHLELFVTAIETHVAYSLTLRQKIRNRELQKICFSDLWHLFNPGDLILNHVSSRSTRSYAYKVFCVSGGRRDATDSDDIYRKVSQQLNPLLLQVLFWEYDGSKVSPVMHELQIQPYSGEKLITELAYFPKQFAADESRTKDLLDRGRHFINSRYGHAMYEESVSHDGQFVEGEFFVDFKSGYESDNRDITRPRQDDIELPRPSSDETEYYQNRVVSTPTRRYLFQEDEEVDVARCEEFLKGDSFPGSRSDEEVKEMDDEHVLLLPDYVVAYSLRTKEWYELTVCHVRLLSPSKQQREKPFDSLVIPPEYKGLLKAMVEDHTGSQSTKQNAASGRDIDLVSGKGRGLIIFLYGPPGVGKTSTAETIAAYTTPPRPLYPITCGDLGTTPEQIQQRLQSHFRLAHRWNCVLLLDEADVYLVERDINDLKRNGIVSVFLRTLEYYSGILFLTSNREGSIDEAFKSRIHVALHYKRIDADGNIKIWNIMLDRIEQTDRDSDKKLPIAFNREKLLAWAKKHFARHELENSDDPGASKFSTWNGRQIRNAFQTAIALASYDRLEKLGEEGLSPEQAMKKSRWRKVHLLPSHFDRVEKVVNEFQQYLNDVRKPDHVRAQARGLRNDGWDGQPQQPSSAYPSRGNAKGLYTPSVTGSNGRPAPRDSRQNPPKPAMRPAKPSKEVSPRAVERRPATLEPDIEEVNDAYDDPYGDGSDSGEEQEVYNPSGGETDGEGQ